MVFRDYFLASGSLPSKDQTSNHDHIPISAMLAHDHSHIFSVITPLRATSRPRSRIRSGFFGKRFDDFFFLTAWTYRQRQGQDPCFPHHTNQHKQSPTPPPPPQQQQISASARPFHRSRSRSSSQSSRPQRQPHSQAFI
ncbi:uncharacterized protein EAE98_011044 [Botrytis deweyae]|uniref:Uncharacterized protein n=1 Tax=Botrytis deweyae TaxID=2478750 RepID=A0ABQ7I754_9HELO|nr:uncharacterized protein EAE98_011044 [Botrytis deweyae]KAF7915701.1 hypothetical protein EAE98_011044 [Botrytis deweyae]